MAIKCLTCNEHLWYNEKIAVCPICKREYTHTEISIMNDMLMVRMELERQKQTIDGIIKLLLTREEKKKLESEE